MQELSETVERKFVDSIDIDEWEIETDSGWHDVSAIHKTIEYTEWILNLCNGMSLITADTHIVFREDMSQVFVKDLKSGDLVMTELGPIAVKSVVETDKSSHMFDVTVDSDDHRFYSNGILSHNTTLATAVILHYILFNEHKSVALLANKGAAAREILDRIRLAYEALPKWLQQGIVTWNKGSIELENGCKCFAAASSSSAIRGKSISLLYIDEAAFLTNWEEFFSSVYPTISSGESTKILLTSTPNGQNHFYNICKNAKLEKDDPKWNGYEIVEAKWDRVPGRGEKWKQETLAAINFNMEQFEQEFCCSFIGTASGLISAATLGNIVTVDPIRENSGVRQFKEPNRKGSYVMVVDVSRGKGLDYSAFSILDVTRMPYDQVCTFRSNTISPIDYATIILKMANTYNEAFVLVEVNDIGSQVSDILHMDYGYENLVFTETKAGRKRISGGFGSGNVDKGVRTTSSVKRLGCNMLKMLVEQNQLLINDEYTLGELHNFERNGASYEAKSGHNDDMVMTLVLFAWMTEQSFFRENTDIDTLSALKEKTDEDWFAELVPFGFVNDGNNDSQGQSWRL